MIQHRKYTICVICSMLTYIMAGPTQSFANNMKQTKYELPGIAFKICNIAFADFSKKIELYSDGDSELAAFMSHIENYNIIFESADSVYLVTFMPKTFRGGHVKGGGSYYEIDKNTLTIEKKIYYK